MASPWTAGAGRFARGCLEPHATLEAPPHARVPRRPPACSRIAHAAPPPLPAQVDWATPDDFKLLGWKWTEGGSASPSRSPSR